MKILLITGLIFFLFSLALLMSSCDGSSGSSEPQEKYFSAEVIRVDSQCGNIIDIKADPEELDGLWETEEYKEFEKTQFIALDLPEAFLIEGMVCKVKIREPKPEEHRIWQGTCLLEYLEIKVEDAEFLED